MGYHISLIMVLRWRTMRAEAPLLTVDGTLVAVVWDLKLLTAHTSVSQPDRKQTGNFKLQVAKLQVFFKTSVMCL